MADTVPPINGVAEVVLSVDDIMKMVEFYSNVLGFKYHSDYRQPPKDREDSNPNPTICFLKICELDSPLGKNGHPQLLALIDYRRHVHAIPRFDGHEVRRSTLNHLAFEIPTDSFDEHLDRLHRLGFETTLSEFPDINAKAIFFSDPEGNQLELICHWNPANG